MKIVVIFVWLTASLVGALPLFGWNRYVYEVQQTGGTVMGLLGDLLIRVLQRQSLTLSDIKKETTKIFLLFEY